MGQVSSVVSTARVSERRVRPNAPWERTRDTRNELLEAGVALFADSSGELLRAFTAGAVATRAGYHRQTFYRYWDTQAGYVEDLIFHLLAPIRPDNTDPDLVTRRTTAPPDLHAFVRDLARYDFELVRSDPHVAMRVGLLMMEVLDDPRFAAEAKDWFDGAIDLLTASFAAVLDHCGREVVAPVTVRDLVRMVQAQLVGFVVEDRMRGREGDGGAAIFEQAVGALFESFTRPIAGPDGKDGPVAG
jgi:AcrR family transcriptional regulator